MQQIAELLQPLEERIRSKLIPSLIGDAMPPSDTERDLWALPTRYGGMGIENPMREASHKRQESLETIEQLNNLIKSSDRDSKVCEQDQKNLKAGVRKTREARKKTEAQRIRAALPPEMQRAMDVAQERGAAAVLSASSSKVWVRVSDETRFSRSNLHALQETYSNAVLLTTAFRFF